MCRPSRRRDEPQHDHELFAASLPTPSDPSLATSFPTTVENQLCNLSPGTRSPSLVYYAHIGGVPHQLLQVDPKDANSPQKGALTDADWQLILGKDPEHFDYTGIDPHMIESYQPRTPYNTNLPPGASRVAPETSPEGTDPVSGREWITDSQTPMHGAELVDLEYACTFKLAQPRDCSDSAVMMDPTLADSCDCRTPRPGNTGPATLSPAENPAVCNDATMTTQDYAKAYPTIRELELARLLGQVQGANEGVISSLCPIHTIDNAAKNDPLYGYRPAMNAIIDRLKQSLNHQCLPESLQITQAPGQDGGVVEGVPCLVLGTFPNGANAPTSCHGIQGGGYKDPDPDVLAHFKADRHAAWVQDGMPGGTNADPENELTCKLRQLAPNQECKDGSDVGWCYMGPGTVAGCTQSIEFNRGALVHDVVTSLQCIEASGSDAGTAGH